MDLMNKKIQLKLVHVELLILLNGIYLPFFYISTSSFYKISREEPDAVFLQEVIPVSYNLIQNLLPEYNSYAGLVSSQSNYRTCLFCFR